jgi:peptidoglycan/LPS O-acetylase OafA/YrhL
MKYRPDIDGLRAVAVLPVVFYHAGFSMLSGGFIGVDVFFVISGYLITLIVAGEIAENRFSLVSFYERRARRILPALTCVIVASFVAGWFVLLPNEMKNIGQSALATALFLSNVYFMLTLDYFGPTAEFAPLLHTWSLAVEEQFYLFFPPLLMMLAWYRWWQPLWVVVGLSVLSFAAAVLMLPSAPEWVFYLIFFRSWELGIGAILALASLPRPQGRLVREGLAVVGLAGILIPAFIFDASTPFPAAAAAPPVIGTAILIWIGAHGEGSMVSAMLARRSVVWIGLISYSLYLWHWPILSFLRIVLGTVELPIEVAMAAVTVSIAMAWLSYRFVEQPFRVHPSRGFGQRPIFVASVVTLVMVTGVGGFLHVSEGLPARLPVAVVTMAAAANDGNARREDCFGRSPAEGLCQVGTSTDHDAPVDFLFWGDSHADAFLPGMDKTADLVGQRGLFAGHTACPPILGVQRVAARQACTRFNESVWSWLEDRPDIGLVILAARWTLSVEGTRYRGEGGNNVRLEWIEGTTTPSADPSNAALVEAGLNATVARILATGRRVVLLGPVPEIGRDVPMASARQTLLGWTSPVSLTRQDYDVRAGTTERLLSRVAETNDGVRYLPLSDLFCDAQHCRIAGSDGQPLYIDDDHISQTAALDLLPPRLKDIWHTTMD